VSSTKKYLFGLIGHPVSHSLSPQLHGAAFAYHGLVGDYRLLDVKPEKIASEFETIKKKGFNGINVTIPHKQAVMPLLDEVSTEAGQVGAVNTIAFDGGKCIGYNTDVYGFSKSLGEAIERENIDTEWSKSALVVGCGGAARAVVAGLCEMGYFDISIFGRDKTKACEFVSTLCKSFGPRGELLRESSLLRAIDSLDEETIAGKFLFVNATPLGQRGEALPGWFSESMAKLDRRALVYDLVYSRDENPTPTEALARANNLSSIDGLDMLVYQAARAFEIWTGLSVPAETMKHGLNFPGRD